MSVEASFHHLRPARTFGPEFLTYVLWAVTPEGRATNLGAVVPNDDGDAKVQPTTSLREFGLILTAEPYFAVTRPSDMVVAQNVVIPETKGVVHPTTAKFEVLQRGQYTVNLSPAQLPATTADLKKTPLQLVEAENAVAIAEASGAGRYAADTLQKAKNQLAQAQDYALRKQSRATIETAARSATQTAEDARLLAIENKQQAQVAAEQQAAREHLEAARSQAEVAAARAEAARLQAQQEAQQRALAQQQTQAAEAQRQAAEQQAQQTAVERQQAELQAQQAQQQAQQSEAQRQAAEQQAQQTAVERQQAELQAQQAQQQAQQSEAQRQAAEQQAQQARLQAQQAEQQKTQAQQEAEQVRTRLTEQLNQIMQTRQTATGVIMTMPDVLFDTGKATLKPGAKLRLAKVAGIILAYPQLHLDINGFTDSTGSPQFNETLSEQRAAAVRDFLISQGVTANNIVAQGYGEAEPIASNASAAGRQLNRRVEMVVSGTAIAVNTPAGTAPAATGGVSGAVTAPAPATTTPQPSAPAVANPPSKPVPPR
jgi:outer membrane protein OmpA-like peptidoglycan-associated protein